MWNNLDCRTKQSNIYCGKRSSSKLTRKERGVTMEEKTSHPILQSLKSILLSPVKRCFFIGLILELFVEICSRRSLWKAIVFLVTNPFVFLYNLLIITATLSISLIVRRKVFTLILTSLLWIIIGIVDLILLQFRTTLLHLFLFLFKIAHCYLTFDSVS